jgi:hypothetical protein
MFIPNLYTLAKNTKSQLSSITRISKFKMKILLTDASSLTSRQLSTILTRPPKNHIVHLLAASGIIGISKLTSHVSKIHPVPQFGSDPYAWLEAALSILKNEQQKFDILICSQEQVAIISAEIDRVRQTGVAVAVPEFKSLRAVMGKIEACRSLANAGLPQPESVVVSSKSKDFEGCDRLLPAFVKTPIGTASRGVRRVTTMEELGKVVSALGRPGEGGKLLVQKECLGSLIMISGVFSHGRLLAWHACVRVYEGISGGASKKVSLPLPIIQTHLEGLGFSLNWHGALSLDAILIDEKPLYIDLNPRICEPVNGLLAGVDLVETLLQVSLGIEGEMMSVDGKPRHGIEGVETHQLVLALLGKAEEGRMMVFVEAFKAVMKFDMYAGSVEELTPVEGDYFWSLFVLLALLIILLVGGKEGAKMVEGETIKSYALSEEGWEMILRRNDERRNDEKRKPL